MHSIKVCGWKQPDSKVKKSKIELNIRLYTCPNKHLYIRLFEPKASRFSRSQLSCFLQLSLLPTNQANEKPTPAVVGHPQKTDVTEEDLPRLFSSFLEKCTYGTYVYIHQCRPQNELVLTTDCIRANKDPKTVQKSISCVMWPR